MAHFRSLLLSGLLIGLSAAEDPYPQWLGEDALYVISDKERIACANEKFAFALLGWKTDCDRIYSSFGPPDKIDSLRTSTPDRAQSVEKWVYRWIEGLGSDITVDFEDPRATGDYRLVMKPEPQANLNRSEQLGLIVAPATFTRTDGSVLGVRAKPAPNRERPPVVTKRTVPPLPIRVRADFLRITTFSTQTNITVRLENKDLRFREEDGVARAEVNVYTRLTSLSGRIVNTFENVLTTEIPSENLEKLSNGASVYQKSFPVPAGRYRMNIVAMDVFGGKSANYEMDLEVPRIDGDSLSHSSVVLADLIEKGSAGLVIGGRRVRPRVGETFSRHETMGIFVKLYNFAADEKTRRPAGQVDYEVVKLGSLENVLSFMQEITNEVASEVTVEKLIPLQLLDPGQYELKLKVTDKLRNQSVTTSARFTVS